MEYNLYDDLVNQLGDDFERSTADFYVLKQYMKLRLGNLICKNDSIQHYGKEDTIFQLKDTKTDKIYQGFYNTTSKSLSIAPIHSFQTGEEGMAFKVSCKQKRIYFTERENEVITAEDLIQTSKIFANTKYYDYKNEENELLRFGFLENMGNKLQKADFLPDYAFSFVADECEYSLDTFELSTLSSSSKVFYNNVSLEKSLSIYFELLDKAISKSDDNPKTKKRTIYE